MTRIPREQIENLMKKINGIGDVDPPRDLSQGQSQILYNQRLIAVGIGVILNRLDEIEAKPTHIGKVEGGLNIGMGGKD